MRELSLDIINSVSPYRVEYDNATKLYRFVSDYHVGFSVAFEENDLLQSGESYQVTEFTNTITMLNVKP